ncbi:MAG: Gfo/Idh/MocA family oxidoreductase [Terrimicrobiaceae bacterium]
MSRSTPRKPVRVAIIGTGGMANVHAECFKNIRTCRLVAACDIDSDRAADFVARHKIPKAYGDVRKLLRESGAEAVSIVTPDASHYPVTMQCLRAGLHVLCEKPLAVNAEDARRMARAAKKAGVINMVNFSYRDWPCIQQAAKEIAAGAIGDIRHVEASYLQAWLASPVWGDWRTTPAWLWRLSTSHGSRGALGDVGVHIIDYATFPVGPIRSVFCRLKTFPKAPGDRIGEYHLDANDSAVLNVEFANGALGVIHTTRWAPGHQNRLALKISGTLGTIDMDSERSTTSYRICNGPGLAKCEWREVECPPTPNNYQRFISSIRSGNQEQPDFQRGAEVQAVLDAGMASDEADRPIVIKATRK